MMEWDMCVAEMGRRQESNRGQGPREMEFEVDGGKLLAELDFPIAFATRQLEKKKPRKSYVPGREGRNTGTVSPFTVKGRCK